MLCYICGHAQPQEAYSHAAPVPGKNTRGRGMLRLRLRLHAIDRPTTGAVGRGVMQGSKLANRLWRSGLDENKKIEADAEGKR